MAEKKSVLEQYPAYRMDIGIEVHVQLNTKTKIFCACPNEQTDTPNKNICPVCAGYPGVLPLLNKEVVNKAIVAGLATHCTVSSESVFARKHYFYPDLPKDYQITQDKKPICTNGYVTIKREDGTQKKIRIYRIHMEEDAGKNIHVDGTNESFVDLNRTGTPLIEIVSHPDIENNFEAVAYLKALHAIIVHTGISTGNMDEGSFRADTNISVRLKNSSILGTRCELKNINSFKFIKDAIEYEAERQIEQLEAGNKITQETRLWDTKDQQTYAMRSKEEAADYRYFQDPDLPILHIDQEWIASTQKNMPELPEQKIARWCAQGLSEYEATILIEDKELGHFYDKAYAITPSKLIINWVLRELVTVLKDHKATPLSTSNKITPEKLASLVSLIDKNTINNRTAQELFVEIAEKDGYPLNMVKERGLEQMDNSAELEALIHSILSAHQSTVEQYKAGKTQLFGFFVGQVMAKTQGKANPKTTSELLKKILGNL